MRMLLRKDQCVRILLRKDQCECRCGCGYVFQIWMELVVWGKISKCTLGSGTIPGNKIDSDNIT